MRSAEYLSSSNLRLMERVQMFNLFDNDEKEIGSVKVRILEPSEPHGSWPGTGQVIHKWEIHTRNPEDPRMALIEDLNEVSMEEAKKAILKLEEILGEWTGSEIGFEMHPTLGLVSLKIL